MSAPTAKTWKCSVCGYIHRQSEPPQWCPVCGASREAFEPYLDRAAVPATAKVQQWRCLNCSYLHRASQPPEVCPVCGAVSERFEPLETTAEIVAGAGKALQVVVAGAGIAGVSAVESIRAASPEAKITLISKEPGLPYYRLNLTRYVAGEITEDALPIFSESWYREQRVQLICGVEVTEIALDERVVKLNGRDEIPFEKLILTVGAHPFVPPFPGAQREGVITFRTIDNARRILETAKSGAKCICIGGGILGLETAAGLAKQGAKVTLLEGSGRLLPRQLNQAAADMLARYVAEMGIDLRTAALTSEIVGDERAHGVLLQDDSMLPADLVVIATGIRPNSYLARVAGLEVNQGIIVDDHLSSSHPDVFAAGDVAEHRGKLYGIWGPAQYQGSIAGMNAVGLTAEFGGIPRSNTLKVLGLDLFSLGQVAPEDASFTVIDQELDGKYFCFVFRDTYLVGAILLGDARLTAAVKKAVEGNNDFSDLLRKRPNASEVLETLAQQST